MVPWLIFSFRLPLFRELQFATRGIALSGSVLILFGASITLGIHNGLMKPRLVEGATSVLFGSVGDDLLVVELDPTFDRSTCPGDRCRHRPFRRHGFDRRGCCERANPARFPDTPRPYRSMASFTVLCTLSGLGTISQTTSKVPLPAVAKPTVPMPRIRSTTFVKIAECWILFRGASIIEN